MTLQQLPTDHVNKGQENIRMAAKGGGIVFVGSIFEYAGRLVLGILLARFMGAEQYGFYTLAGTTIFVLSGIALLGLGNALTRYISIFASRKDDDAIWGVLQLGISIPMVLGVLLSVGVFIYSDSLSNLLFHNMGMSPLLKVAAIGTPFSVLEFVAIPATRGFKNMHYSVIVQNIVLTTLKLVLTVLVAFTGLTALKATTVHVVSEAVAALLLLYFLHRLFPLTRPLKQAKYDLKELLRFSLPSYVSRLLYMFGSNIQTFLLGILNTVVSVGVFAAASRASIVGNMFNMAISTVAMPVVSELYVKQDREQLGHFYQTMTKWVFAFNLPIFFMTVLFANPILQIFGSDFTEGSLALIILASGNLIDAATGICNVLILMSGNTWLNMWNSIGVLGVTLGLNFWLIPEYGVLGAAIASSAAIMLLNVVRTIQVYFIMKLTPYNREILKPLIAGIVALVFTYAVNFIWLGFTSFLAAGLGIIFLALVYIAGIVLLGVSEEDKDILRRIFSRVAIVGKKTHRSNDKP